MSAPEAARPSRWDLGSAAAVAAVAGAQLRFALLDHRLPRDLGLFYKDLPRLADAGPTELAAALLRPGGWLQVLLASAPSAAAFRAADLVSVTAAVALGAALARHLAGPRAGFAAAALLGTLPALVMLGRLSWLHVPEAALVLGATLAWVRDPGLQRRATAPTLALLGLLAITLRPSGALWTFTLAPALALTARGAPRRLGLALVPWVVSALVPLAAMTEYVGAKLDARARYAEQLPVLFEQLVSLTGAPLLLLSLVGLGLAAARREHRAGPARWLVGAWVALALALWLVFRAGLDNFPLLGVGLVVLGAAGLARHPAGPTLAGALLAAQLLVPLLPSPVRRALPQGPWLPRFVVDEDLRNPMIPWTGYGRSELEALVAATCPAPDAPCLVAVDQGLAAPYSEDPGNLELFLLGARHVTLLPLAHIAHLPEDLRTDALVHFVCPRGEDHWRRRFPDSAARLADMLQDLGMQPVWEDTVGPECAVVWMTPGGALPHAEALPATGRRVEAGHTPPPPDRPVPGVGPGPHPPGWRPKPGRTR